MAAIQEKGIRIFSVPYDVSSTTSIQASHDQMESTINDFLDGDGTIDGPKKSILGDPQFVVDVTNSVLFVFLKYERIN